MFIIYTYQCVGIADNNNKTYESKYGTYSKADGFILSDLAQTISREELLHNIMQEDCWHIKKEPKKMTKAEIEKALGYEIEIEDKTKEDKDYRKPLHSRAIKEDNEFDDDILRYLFW